MSNPETSPTQPTPIVPQKRQAEGSAGRSQKRGGKVQDKWTRLGHFVTRAIDLVNIPYNLFAEYLRLSGAVATEGYIPSDEYVMVPYPPPS